MGPRLYNVDPRGREPLLEFIIAALEGCGCRVIHKPPPDKAPYVVTFDDPQGHRLGIVAYAFTANTRHTKNRPEDEHRFQLKYGSKDGKFHELWQDPTGLHTTLLVGINAEQGFFVGADPVLHSPTRFFISVEFKQHHVDDILRRGWHWWERAKRETFEEHGTKRIAEQREVLVGGTPAHFLRYIRFERAALREDQGHRELLAEQAAGAAILVPQLVQPPELAPAAVHALAVELALSEKEVLSLIESAPRLKMAVRGWVAEEHLVRTLCKVPGVTECERLEKEKGPDVRLRFEGSRPITIECKNVLRDKTRDGLVRLDFQRMRRAKDFCSRYYAPSDFHIVAACLHPVTKRWEFEYALTASLDPHAKCPGKLSNNVKLNGRWRAPVEEVLRAAAGAR
jgi:hypothetical protein